MLLEDQDLQKMVDECRNGQYFWQFGEGDDSFIYGVHIFFSLYFFEYPTLEKRELIYKLCERFIALTGDNLKRIYFGTGGVHKPGSKYGQIRGKKENYDKDKSFFLELASAVKAEDSAQYYFDSLVGKDNQQQRFNMDHNKYSHLRLGVPVDWFQGSNRQALLALVLDAASQLGAQQGYGGYGWALPMNSDIYPDFESTEHYFAHHFYGFDIDKPFYMRSSWEKKWSLQKGLRTPSWLTFVGEEWLPKLGGAAELAKRLLDHPQVQVFPYSGGLAIQAGENPEWYPVDEGVPSVMAHVAALLKPARPQTLNLLSYERWDGDEEMEHVFFDLNKSARWLGRYDPDSDWPSPSQHYLKPDPGQPTPNTLPGEPVPQTGHWWSPAFKDDQGRRFFTAGEHFPATETTSYGRVFWYFSG